MVKCTYVTTAGYSVLNLQIAYGFCDLVRVSTKTLLVVILMGHCGAHAVDVEARCKFYLWPVFVVVF